MTPCAGGVLGAHYASANDPTFCEVTADTGCPPGRCAEMSARPERSEGSESKACSGLICHSVKPFDRLRANGGMQSTVFHEHPHPTGAPKYPLALSAAKGLKVRLVLVCSAVL